MASGGCLLRKCSTHLDLLTYVCDKLYFWFQGCTVSWRKESNGLVIYVASRCACLNAQYSLPLVFVKSAKSTPLFWKNYIISLAALILKGLARNHSLTVFIPLPCCPCALHRHHHLSPWRSQWWSSLLKYLLQSEVNLLISVLSNNRKLEFLGQTAQNWLC